MILGSPITRLALGIVGMLTSAFLLADQLFGLIPDETAHKQANREMMVRMAMGPLTERLVETDLRSAQALLDDLRARHPDLLAVAVRKAEGVVLSSGPYLKSDSPLGQERDHVQSMIRSGTEPWGVADFVFPAAGPKTLAGLLGQRKLWICLGLAAFATLGVALYLRRALSYLDPLTIVPDRIRAAFDTLNEGVLLLDRHGRVVLANQAMLMMAAVRVQDLHGQRLEVTGLLKSPEGASDTPPWRLAMDSGRSVHDLRVLVDAGASSRVASLDCSPITDGRAKVRGCLVTLSDLTEIERSNDRLRRALEDLKESQATIEAQNRDLIRLALHDGLTGLLNRRAFFESAEKILARCSRNDTPVAVIMLDVDHFKSFNDRYGHATGDLVLQRVAKCLQESLRASDLCARYGGEEFCALMEGLTEDEADQMAQRIRTSIQQHAGLGIDAGADLTVTASLGLCAPSAPSRDLAQMLKLADEALYVAKRSGRNRVQRATSGQAVTAA